MAQFKVERDLFKPYEQSLTPWVPETSVECPLGEKSGLKDDIAGFLLSLHDAAPDFGRIGLPEAGSLPAVRWKVINLEKLKRADPKKHAVQRRALESLFE